MHERLLAVAHGTASPEGIATIERLVAAVAAARPEVDVDLCYLDVVEPALSGALDERPTVAVPLLLSTGYHAQADIPAAAAGFPAVRVARHLGPHPLLVDVLVDRLAASPGRRAESAGAGSLVLAAAGSSRSEAAVEVARTAELLSARLGRAVATVTMAQDLPAFFAAQPAPVDVATYLLAQGQFVNTLKQAVAGRGRVAAPLGVHPLLVQLIWQRYDEVRATGRLPRVAG